MSQDDNAKYTRLLELLKEYTHKLEYLQNQYFQYNRSESLRVSHREKFKKMSSSMERLARIVSQILEHADIDDETLCIEMQLRLAEYEAMLEVNYELMDVPSS
jgi:hypothetical protein